MNLSSADRSILRLSDIASVTRGASPRPIASPRWFSNSSNVGWVRISDLGRSDGLKLITTTQRLSPDGIVRSRFLPAGTLIMSIAATVGEPIVTGFPTCIHDGFVAIQNLRAVDQTYLLYVLKSLKDELRSAGQTGSQANVNTEIVNDLLIPLPPMSEQKRIAAALSDTDSLIATLERLITKKQAIKQGMMQQLLTGKTRLPGFEGAWTETSIAEVATVDPDSLTGSTHAKTAINYISLEDVSRGEILGSNKYVFSEAPSRARRIVQYGDVLFGTVRPQLQSHALYEGGLENPIASTGFAVVRASRSVDPSFIWNTLMSSSATSQIDRIIAGSNYPAISSRDVKRLRFMAPEISEQRAISKVLGAAEAEIVNLRARLAKTRAIKTGMMQELLTGRTRLPLEEGSA